MTVQICVCVCAHMCLRVCQEGEDGRNPQKCSGKRVNLLNICRTVQNPTRSEIFHHKYCKLFYLLCTLVRSSPPCRPLTHSGHSWNGQRSHPGPCRTCCRKVRSSLNRSGSEASTQDSGVARGDGTSATVLRGSTWRRGGPARSADLKGNGNKVKTLMMQVNMNNHFKGVI